jgi:hypothetical protein
MASRITAPPEEYGLLPPQHMGAHPGRSTDTALDMLFKQIYNAWQVASLISLDMTGGLIESYLYDSCIISGKVVSPNGL